MRKIINTFKYGDKKVKGSLLLAILSGIVTLVFAVLAIVMSNMLCFFVAIMAGFITISLVQTFMIAEGENPTVVRPVVDAVAVSTEHMEVSPSNIPDISKPKKSKKLKSEAISKKNKSAKEVKTSEATETTQTIETMDAWHEGSQVTEKVEENTDSNKSNKNKKVKKEKSKKVKIKKEKVKTEEEISETKQVPDDETVEYQGEVDMASILNQMVTQEPPEEEQEENINSKVITAETAATYTKKKIKKTLHKYKVMKDHRMVIVDRCDRLHIYQTPAYVWVQDNQFHILLIEETPRLLMVPLFRITEISYLKKQPADEEKDYKLFKKSTILTESFRPYLPDYNHSNKTTDLTSYKNLYGITQGIYFTNNSAKNLFDLLGVDFYVEDKVTTSNKVNIFFKEAYKANIKLRDNILDANGYAENITKVLDDMARSSISYAEFKDTLNLMIRNKLITEEYASHYMDVRNSIHG